MDDAGTVSAIEGIGDLDTDLQRLRDRQRSLLQSLLQRLAGDVLHHQVVDAVLVADIVQDADVRVVQRRNAARFALEPLAATRIGRKAGGSTLMATVRSSRVSRARYTSPIPPAPSNSPIW